MGLLASAAGLVPLAAQEQYALQFQGPVGRGVSLTLTDAVFANVAFGIPKDEIRTTAGDFLAAGFTAGMVVRVSGSGHNDGLYTLDTVAQRTLILDPHDQLLSETAAGPVSLAAATAPCVQVPASLPADAWAALRAVAAVDVPVAGGASPRRHLNTLSDLVFSDLGLGNSDEILTLGGDFSTLGFVAGTVFAVRGSASNDGLYTVAEVKEAERGSEQFNVLVLESGATLSTEGDALTPATAALLQSAPGFTVEAWVKFEDYAAGQFPPKWEAVVTKGQAWALSRYSNTNRVTFSTWTGSDYHDVVGVSDLQPRRWHHLAGVYDGTTKSLYVDGVLAASAAWSGPLLCDGQALELGNAPVLAGDTRLKAGRALKGGLDGVRVWSVVRTAEQLNALMDRRLRGSEVGLIGEWRFDETPGGPEALSALDSSMNANHGSLLDLDPRVARVNGSDSQVPPEPLAVVLGAALDGNFALRLNGADQYVEVTNEVIFDFTSGFALELWVNLEALPAPGTEAALMSKGPSAYELVVDEDGYPVFRTGGTLAHGLRGTTALELGQWHHVACLWNAGVKTLMLDGAIDAEAYGVPSPVGQNDLPLCFGARPLTASTAEAFLTGLIDELRAWAYARTADQIAQSLHRTLTGREPGLAGWWPLDEGEGPVAADAKEVVPKPGSLVTLQFEQLAFAGNQIKRYPSTYIENSSDPAIDPDGAADDSFLVENSLVATDSFAVKGEAMADYPGSTALYNAVPNADTILRMFAGERFRVVSIDLGDLNNEIPPGTQVTFRATVSGLPLERTFELDGVDTVPELFELLRFNSVSEVRWRQTYPYHLFDNIILQRLRDLLPAHLKADAILHNLPDWARIDSPLEFDDPVPPQYALRFDGDGDWVSVEPPAGQDGYFERHSGATPLPFTLEVWVRPATLFTGSAPNSTDPFQTLIRQGDTGWGLAIDAAGYLRYWIADDPDSSLASDRPLDPGVWQHVALVVDPATNTVAFFINGAVAGDHEVSIVSHDTANHALIWGRKGALTEGGWFTGDLDEVRLWDYARDADEIFAFANRQLPDGMSGLLGYWRLNDGIGDTAEDSSGNGLLADLYGTLSSPDMPEWIYGPQPPNRDGMWALQFDGVDDYLQTPDSLNFNPKADAIRSLSGAFAGLGLRNGQAITLAEAGPNNGDLLIEGVRPERLLVRPAAPAADPLDALSPAGTEALPASALLLWNRLLRDSLVFKDNGPDPDQIVSLSGSFTPLGLQPGDLIVVRENTDGNNGEYVVAEVQPMTLTLAAGEALTAAGDPPPLASARLYRGLRLTDLIFQDNATAPAELTLEAWVYPMAATAIDAGQPERRRTILMKEVNGWGLALDANGSPVLLLNGAPAARASAPGAKVYDEIWQHVGVTVDQAANEVVFYHHGVVTETLHPAVDLGTSASGPLYTGRQGLGTTGSPARHHYKGYLDELRVWTYARTPAQMAQTAMRQLFRGSDGLASYWNFNRFDPEALDDYDPEVNFLEVFDESGNGHTASLDSGVMSVRAYVPGLYDLYWDGDFWDDGDDGDGDLDLSRSTSTRGLWVGKVVLNAVNEVQTASSTSTGQITPTADTMAFTILLHVDSTGRVRLLKDVIVLRLTGAATEETLPEEEDLSSSDLVPVGEDAAAAQASHVALITDTTYLPDLTLAEGSAPRRISAPAYDFEGNELALQGGLGPDRGVTGTILLPRLHPTNPFRHKYHPDHRNTNPDNPDYGYQITRRLTLRFNPTDDGLAAQGGYGIQTLSGTYRETITGLHKTPLITTGTIDLQRISTVGRLNP